MATSYPSTHYSSSRHGYVPWIATKSQGGFKQHLLKAFLVTPSPWSARCASKGSQWCGTRSSQDLVSQRGIIKEMKKTSKPTSIQFQQSMNDLLKYTSASPSPCDRNDASKLSSSALISLNGCKACQDTAWWSCPQSALRSQQRPTLQKPAWPRRWDPPARRPTLWWPGHVQEMQQTLAYGAFPCISLKSAKETVCKESACRFTLSKQVAMNLLALLNGLKCWFHLL